MVCKLKVHRRICFNLKAYFRPGKGKRGQKGKGGKNYPFKCVIHLPSTEYPKLFTLGDITFIYDVTLQRSPKS